MENQMLSLYEYLGHAAGPTLGKQVAEAAAKAGVPISSHEVSNVKYTGTILKYPKPFLDQYFNKSKLTRTDYIVDTDNDILPF